jgi:type IV secretion system protein VirD4
MVATLVRSQALIGEQIPQTIQAYQTWALQHWPYLAGGYAAAIAASIAVKVMRDNRTPHDTGHGSAAWATSKEIRRSDLWKSRGIVLGWHQGHRLEAPAWTNVIVVGPAGCGKTTTVFEPTIVDYPGSVICLDLKGRITSTTIAARRQLGPVYVMDPTNPRGDHYNPHDGIRWGRAEVRDVQAYADHRTYVDAKERSDKGTYFRDSAMAGHVAGTIYNHYACEERDSPSGMLRFFRSPTEPFDEKLKRMAAFRHPVDPEIQVVESWAGSMLQIPRREERKQLWDSTLRWLTIFDDPDLAKVTNDTTIDLSTLQQSSMPATLYLRISASDVNGRLQPETRIWLNQIVMHLEDRHPWDYHFPVLNAFDDAAELGDFDLILHIAAYLREYGGWLLLGAQSFGQLWQTFGKESGLFDNLTTWVLFRPSYPTTAELISEKLGDMTVIEPTDRTTRTGWRRSYSKSIQTHRRRLATAQEVSAIGDKKLIVCYKGEPPMLVDRGD